MEKHLDWQLTLGPLLHDVVTLDKNHRRKLFYTIPPSRALHSYLPLRYYVESHQLSKQSILLALHGISLNQHGQYVGDNKSHLPKSAILIL